MAMNNVEYVSRRAASRIFADDCAAGSTAASSASTKLPNVPAVAAAAAAEAEADLVEVAVMPDPPSYNNIIS